MQIQESMRIGSKFVHLLHAHVVRSIKHLWKNDSASNTRCAEINHAYGKRRIRLVPLCDISTATQARTKRAILAFVNSSSRVDTVEMFFSVIENGTPKVTRCRQELVGNQSGSTVWTSHKSQP